MRMGWGGQDTQATIENTKAETGELVCLLAKVLVGADLPEVRKPVASGWLVASSKSA